MKSADTRWQLIRTLFDQATELPTGPRGEFIQRASGDDSSLYDELQALLNADECQKKKPLTDAIGAAVDATIEGRKKRLLGTVVDRYTLTRILGHGGVGTVYLGEELESQGATPVAIKIVERAARHAETHRRFRGERQILADLNHPNIARMFDAGDTREGYPYLVMEYVQGEPIDTYCDRHRLRLDARVRLFLQACDAIDYAHRNLIIHRDIKPANILVTAAGTPKLLDFGIAKLLDPETDSTQALTRLQDQLLTPEYASPEQILGQHLTTASDVYALGVVLYELLTGLRPYKLATDNRLELERSICTADATKPSTAVRLSLQANYVEPLPTRNIHTVAALRNSTPTQLRSQLKNDLDAILLRALRKEPTDRYNSVEQFADDLRCYLACEPVLAREGNWVYYFDRFVRRHLSAVATVIALLAIACFALVAVNRQSDRVATERNIANEERRNAEAVTDFMIGVFDPVSAPGKPSQVITAANLLDRASLRVQGDFNGDPKLQVRLLEAIGWNYYLLGRPDRSVALIEKAIGVRLATANADTASLATALRNLGRAQIAHGDLEGANHSFGEARTILDTDSMETTKEHAVLFAEFGRLELQRGNLELARKYFDSALPGLRKHFGAKHPEVADALSAFANVFQWQNDYASMERLVREAVEIYRAVLPPLHPDRLLAEGLLGRCLLYQNRIAEAAPIIEQSYDAKKRVFGDTNLRIVVDLQALIELRRAQDRLGDAENYAREMLTLESVGHRDDAYYAGYSRTTLATILWLRGKPHEAERELRSALAIYGNSLAENHPYVTSAKYYLAETLLAQNKIIDAINVATPTLTELVATNAPQWRIARIENTIGQALLLRHKPTAAGEYLERSYKTLAVAVGLDQDTVRLARTRLERFYLATGNTSKLHALRANIGSAPTTSPLSPQSADSN